MIKLLIYIFRICLLTSVAATCISCEPGNIGDEKEEGKSAVLRLLVKMDEPTDIATRAASETGIHDVHVLVYDSNNELIGQKYQIGGGKVEVIIRDINNSTKNCTVYVIANSNKEDLFKGYDIHKVDYLEKMIYKISTWNELVNGSYIMMTGSEKNVDITASKQALPIEVKRIAAKITLNFGVKAEGGIIISNYSIRDLPAKSYYLLRPLPTETLEKDGELPGDDASRSDNDADWINSTVTAVNGGSATTTLYMLENRRGVNNSITEQNGKALENAPKRATYIDINGTVNGINVNWKVYLGADNKNNFNIKRNCTYSYSIVINGIESVDARVIVEPGSINLSKEGTANCYLASASNQWYGFDGTVRGNGETQDYVAEQYPGLGISLMPTPLPSSSNATQIPANIIKDAVVVWETSPGLIQNIRWDRGSRHVKFKTGTATGNAVIAVRDASHTILWSWHIWLTEGIDLNSLNQSSSPHVMTIQTNTDRQWYADLLHRQDIKRRRSITMLRCNIGAQLNAKCSYDTPEGNIGIYNLQYQFGRKDPLPGTATYTSNQDVRIYGFGSSNAYQTAGFTIGEKAIHSDNINGNTLDYVIQHPEQFIGNNADLGQLNNQSSWFHNATEDSPEVKTNRCLWGDNNTETIIVNSGGLDPDPWGTGKETGRKTIYDPCPAGWRVSAADSWTGIGKDNMDKSWLSLSEDKFYHGSYNKGHTFFFGSPSGISTFCPATGTRSAVGNVSSVGSVGAVWFSSPSVKHGTYFWTVPSAIHLASDMLLVYAIPVRCTKIEP